MTDFEMRLEQLTERLKPVSAESWEALTFQFLGNEFDRETLECLRADLRKHGRFREPIVFLPTDESISNGQHRIVASLLEERERITCSYEPPTPDEHPSFDISLTLEKPKILDELGDRISGALRSFKVSEDLWVECFVASRRGILELSCECPADQIDNVISRIGERLEQIGVNVRSAQAALKEDSER